MDRARGEGMKEGFRKKSLAVEEIFDRRLPLALVGAFLLQAGAAVWWAATKDSDDRFAQQHMDRLDSDLTETRDAESHILERLARIEERVDEEMSILDRIEKQRGQHR
jgi:hypothetical protein